VTYQSLLVDAPAERGLGYRAAETIVRVGAGGLARWRLRNTLTILMYHRFAWVPDARTRLERQFAFVRQHFTPLALSDAASRLRSGGLPPRALCITVDDGHADFRDIALPVLQAHGLPATLFVATDFVSGRDWLWFDQLEYALRSTRQAALPHPVSGSPLGLDSSSARRECFAILVERAKQLPDAARRAFPKEIAAQLGVTIPAAPPAEFSPVSWSDLKTMRDVEVGVHTQSHPILAQVNDATALRNETLGARQEIEAALDRPAPTFCYPNGQPEDISTEVVAAVQEAGFTTAVTTVRDRVRRPADPLRLPRLGVGPELPFGYFARLVSGLAR
jgi:peptidoglycan/xylan/chitin deacetylase (PgdA/CDA1 family)